MTWTYQQSTGFLTEANGSQFIGYSGTGAGRNNASMQSVHDIGPLPRGFYTIAPARNDPKLGPCTMSLIPYPENEMFGRSGFDMHGDNPQHDASHGCIVMPPSVRNLVSTSDDKILSIIP